MQCKHAAGRKHCETFLLSGPTFISDYFCIQSRSPLRDKCITTISLLALKMTLWRCQLFMKLQFLVYRILHYFPPKTIYFLNACHLGWWSWPPWPAGPPWSPTPPGPPGLHRPPGPPCPPGHSNHPNHSDHLDHMDHLDHLDQMVHLFSTFRSPSVCLSQTWHLNFSW